MGKLKGKHLSSKAYYSGYKAQSREAKNRDLKLLRHMEKHPNDLQTQAAMKKAPVHRAKSKGRGKVSKGRGMQEVKPNVWSYIPDRHYANGHPVVMLLKQPSFERQRKLRYSAVLSDDFVAVWLER